MLKRKKVHRAIFTFLLAVTSLVCHAKTFDVYFLGGQSNMEGYGYSKTLEPLLREPSSEIYLFTGNPANDDDRRGGAGVWAPLQPGTGVGFKSNGRVSLYSDRFGPEVSFGHTIDHLSENRHIAIIKYAKGGSGLAENTGHGSWDPYYNKKQGINQFDHFLTTVRQAFEEQDIDLDGELDTLLPAGIVWMQGEADASAGKKVAMAYEKNLMQMMKLIKAALRNDSIPVIIGKITDSGVDNSSNKMPYIDEIHRAQKAFVDNDICAAYVTVLEDEPHIADGWHYTSKSYVKLGEAFAQAMWSLKTTCP
ncbi:sialate O-acetylesterase [Aestuariibacter sp. A3R04]|uniref:sialate O-acetylesterase n=1 Tax=Aestuariibacter sp. A3R04 TaxID=2841571 RepID=UPI001C08D357|nr:sialate O-acetylesterase [Aestuariibacter sp. A3R04]MBU3022967.1 sialate O-acetylesterase [Aestuariibacter sp. A3R04]